MLGDDEPLTMITSAARPNGSATSSRRMFSGDEQDKSLSDGDAIFYFTTGLEDFALADPIKLALKNDRLAPP
jgi:hypothetical protein